MLLTGLHQIFAVPLILAAETLESPVGTGVADWSRVGGTVLADSLAGIGFALLLGAVWRWRGRALDWRRGLLWGLAGFYVMALAPAFGLPPELPGAASAALATREAWWLATVVCSALGLAALVFLPGLARKLPGLLLLSIPHLAGAPLALGSESLATAAMTAQFQWVALASSAVFWLALGALGGALYPRVVHAPG